MSIRNVVVIAAALAATPAAAQEKVTYNMAWLPQGSSIGVIVAVVLLWLVPWGMAVVAGWDAAAIAFLISVWPITRLGSSRPSGRCPSWT